MSDSTEPLKDRIRRVADEFEKYVGPDGKVNATALVDRIEILTAENRNLWDAISLERRLKNRFIGALEKAGIDPDDVPHDPVSTHLNSPSGTNTEDVGEPTQEVTEQYYDSGQAYAVKLPRSGINDRGSDQYANPDDDCDTGLGPEFDKDGAPF